MSSLKVLVTATAVFLSLCVGVPAAQAGEGWNDYWTTLPAFITLPTDFTVDVDGPSAVCSMAFNATTLDAAPWTFTFDPTRNTDPFVYVKECDGATDWIRVDSQAPYALDQTILTARAVNQSITVSNRTAIPATAVLRDSRGTDLSRIRIEPAASAVISLSLKSLKRSAVYSVTVIGDDGTNQLLPLLIAKGYATFDFLGSSANFTPCSTLAWGYDPVDQQPKATTFRDDIQPALNRIARHTGLTFIYSDDYANADLRFHWGDVEGAAAIGGTDGGVEVSTTAAWPTDRFSGFGPFRPTKWDPRSGPGGRGWLIIHEVLHSLGFDHVRNAKSVMSPVNRGQHAFDQGTLDGMHAIYRSQCVPNGRGAPPAR